MIIVKDKNKVINEVSSGESFKMIAKTMYGLEEVLAEELRALGAKDVTPINRAVAFTGTMQTLYKANYACRTALAILKPFAEFEANNEQELYDNIYKIKWEQILDVDCKFFIESAANSKIFTNSYYAALKMKDAIVDRFRRMFGRRPTIDTENADYKFNIHINANKVTLLMNSSGESLHKRGYRQGVGIAPINEVLAAGLIQLSGWKADCHFFDPMCGSGTILIEAAMYANNIPAQYYRKKLIGGSSKIFYEAEKCGAIGTYISGSGSALVQADPVEHINPMGSNSKNKDSALVPGTRMLNTCGKRNAAPPFSTTSIPAVRTFSKKRVRSSAKPSYCARADAAN